MASKKVVDREKALSVLRHTVDQYMPAVARDLDALLSPELQDGEHVPDAHVQADLQLRRLERLFARLASADHHVLNLGAEKSVRTDEADAATADLRRTLMDMRKVVRGLYRRRSSEILGGVPGQIPRQKPQPLLRMTKLVIERLTDPERRPPSVEAQAASAEMRSGVVRTLRPGVRRLEEAEARRLNAETTLKGAHATKNKAMEVYNAAFMETAAAIAAQFRLAGHSKLADELQPSRQEPGLLHKQVKLRRAARAGHKKAGSTEVDA